jgi:hypothetical protein
MKKSGKIVGRKATLKKLPVFKTEDAEREFWAHADSTEYIDWREASQATFPSLKRSSAAMRSEYDFSKSRNNPCAGRLKRD